jgi:hypothetical protein
MSCELARLRPLSDAHSASLLSKFGSASLGTCRQPWPSSPLPHEALSYDVNDTNAPQFGALHRMAEERDVHSQNESAIQLSVSRDLC